MAPAGGEKKNVGTDPTSPGIPTGSSQNINIVLSRGDVKRTGTNPAGEVCQVGMPRNATILPSP